MKWRALGANALLVLAAALLGLAVAEVAVRLAAPQQLIEARPDVWQPVDSLGWMFRPDLTTTVNTGERSVHLFTDREAMRVGAAGRIEADRRVLLIGDSFMAALQVEYEQSVPGLLEVELPKAVDRPVAVRNAGVAGWDPPQYLVRARQLLAGEHFDALVVMLYLGNDIVADRRSYIPPLTPTRIAHLRLPSALSATELIDAFARPVNDQLEQHSHLFILFKNRLKVLWMRLGLSAEYFPDEFRKSEAGAPRWDITASIVAEIAQAATARGTPTLIVLIPAPYQVEPTAFAEYVRAFGIDSASVDLTQPTQLMGSRLSALGLSTLDPLPAFRTAAAEGQQLFGTVDRHLSPAGHVLLTSLVVPTLETMLEPPSVQKARAHPR